MFHHEKYTLLNSRFSCSVCLKLYTHDFILYGINDILHREYLQNFV